MKISFWDGGSKRKKEITLTLRNTPHVSNIVKLV